MKKSFAIFFTAALLAASVFAENTDAKDDYNDGTASTEKKVKITKSSQNSDSNWLKEFLFGKEKYIEYDTVRLGTGTITYGIKAREATMLYNPTTKTAGVRTYYQTNFYNVLFDAKNRTNIISAIKNYQEDFENKRLVRKSEKTKRAYGKGKAHIEWGTVKLMMDKFSETDVWYGYTFINKSPYFSIIVKQAKNLKEHQSEYASKESIEVQLYFNRTQAKEFAAQLAQKGLDELQAEYDEQMAIADTYKDASEDYTDSYEDSEPVTPLKEKDSEKEEKAVEPAENSAGNTEIKEEEKPTEEDMKEAEKEAESYGSDSKDAEPSEKAASGSENNTETESKKASE